MGSELRVTLRHVCVCVCVCVCVLSGGEGVCYLQKKPPVSSTRVKGEWEKSGRQFINNEHGKRGECLPVVLHQLFCLSFLSPAFFHSLTDCYECRAHLNNVLFTITVFLLNTA